ncbi:TauD/TfdA family dioxygenase [Rhodococcus ruber]|uniref:TauD/TfdA family dioxygenase n=1 Tax=Rhodococcus ruber TaxID=1830 RepID=UPI00167C8C12|nr:TauD/TfdA family dioxygenase [Rhodococcus ruber]
MSIHTARMSSRSRQPVDARSVWLPNDFPTDRTWSYELTDTQVDCLVEYGRGAPIDELRSAFENQSTLWPSILGDGPGFLRIRGFPVQTHPAEQTARSYLGMASIFGSPVAQDRAGNLITDIRDERSAAVTGRRYQTNLAQDFHTDAADLVGLLCLRSAKTGGESRIVSAHTVYNEMLRTAPELLEVLYTPMPWSRNNETQGAAPFFELAPITDVCSVPRIFLIPWYIWQSQQHGTAPRLTGDQVAALTLVTEIAARPELHIEMTFEPGDLQLLNNTTVLHSRAAYADHDDPARRRHLLRLWLSIGTTPDANSVSLPVSTPRSRR